MEVDWTYVGAISPNASSVNVRVRVVQRMLSCEVWLDDEKPEDGATCEANVDETAPPVDEVAVAEAPAAVQAPKFTEFLVADETGSILLLVNEHAHGAQLTHGAAVALVGALITMEGGYMRLRLPDGPDHLRPLTERLPTINVDNAMSFRQYEWSCTWRAVTSA